MREADLITQGWTRRFVAAPPRLQEVAELYAALGYEVRLEQVDGEELADQCRSCALAAGLLKIVYTCPAKAKPEAKIIPRGSVRNGCG